MGLRPGRHHGPGLETLSDSPKGARGRVPGAIGSAGRIALTLLAVLATSSTVLVLARAAGRAPSDPSTLAATSAMAFFTYYVARRRLERREPPEASTRSAFFGIAAGMPLGIALFTTVLGLLWIAGAYRPQGLRIDTPIGEGLLTAFFIAAQEETLFRGILYRLISTVSGDWAAVAGSAILFGLAHAFKPGATAVSTMAVALEAGLLLASAYLLSGSLWFPIGLHAGWNFAEASLFGMAESGGAASPGLIAGDLHGPRFLTGGAFGPEASVVSIGVCVAAAAAMLYRVAHESGRGSEARTTIRRGLT